MTRRFAATKQVKWHWQAKILKVNINGMERTLDATSGLGEDVIQELAGHLGMNVTQLEDLLHLGHTNQHAAVNVSHSEAVNSGVVQTAAPNQQPVTRKRVTLIQCPKCSHRIAEAAWCLYCGHELNNATTAERVNEVDKAILEHDVKAENKVEATVKQQLRDSFSDRLKDM